MRSMLPRTPRRSKRASVSATGGPVAPEASYVDRRSRSVRAGARTRGTVFPRRRPAVPVRRAVFAGLIFASLALITVSYQGEGEPSGVQLVVLEVVSPIERGLSRAWDPIAGAWDWSGRLISSTNENPSLKSENAKLREQLRFATEQEEENQRLQRALAFDETFAYPNGYDRIWAEVTVRQPGAIEHSLVVDRGTSDGVRIDDPVMVPGGLIGRVTSVTRDNAIIGLLLDDTQSVSASVTGSEAWGVLKTVSNEGGPTMQLRFVRQSAEVDIDDQVVTSGFASKNGELRSIYPKGLPIGIVTNVGNDPADLHKTVQVTPFADFDRIDEVMILVRTSRGVE
ncbi:MAG: rod shape-determining protein MreC [Thermoleophilia bacterium]|nr:rod shape-determining protein MreC [Thermoleophilia bacterium]